MCMFASKTVDPEFFYGIEALVEEPFRPHLARGEIHACFRGLTEAVAWTIGDFGCYQGFCSGARPGLRKDVLMNRCFTCSLAAVGLLLGVGCGGEAPSSDAAGPTAADQNALEAAGRVDFFVQVLGSTSGRFPGESEQFGRLDWIPAIRFYQNVSKTPKGDTKCSSISFTKAVGLSSPVFASAVATGETMSKVTLEFVQPTGFLRQRIELTGVRVSKYEEAVAPPDLNVSSALLEEITLEPNPTATETISAFTQLPTGLSGPPLTESFTCSR